MNDYRPAIYIGSASSSPTSLELWTASAVPPTGPAHLTSERNGS